MGAVGNIHHALAKCWFQRGEVFYIWQLLLHQSACFTVVLKSIFRNLSIVQESRGERATGDNWEVLERMMPRLLTNQPLKT
jgi:hypothetical protein